MSTVIQNLLRRHYQDIQGYVSAGMESGKDEAKTFMNANENPYVLDGLEGYNRYPEPQPKALLEAYAHLYDVKPEQIVATRGADEAIHVLVTLFCEPHQDAIVVCPPTFGMYGSNADAMPVDIIEQPLIKQEDGRWSLDVPGIIARGEDPKAKMVFLCSPNNPTGHVFAEEDMRTICDALKDKAMIMMDETYIEFAQAESFTAHLADYPNMIVLRTLSKSYAAAGIRMGCMISGDTDFIALVKAKALDAYPIPKPCVEAALTIMQPDNVRKADTFRAQLLDERKRLEEAFRASPHVSAITPSDANFFLVEMPEAKAFLKYCAAENIILRDFSDRPLTPNCVRISVGLPQENDKLLELLERFTPQA